jgi:hypothetical protein
MGWATSWAIFFTNSSGHPAFGPTRHWQLGTFLPFFCNRPDILAVSVLWAERDNFPPFSAVKKSFALKIRADVYEPFDFSFHYQVPESQ